MTYEELKNILEFAKNYFLGKYPGKDIYVQEIQSHVGQKYEQYYDKSKSEWQSFVVILVEQKWSGIYKRDYKIHIKFTNEDGKEVIQKTKPELLDDIKSKKRRGEQDDEELVVAAQYEKGGSKAAQNIEEGDFSEFENEDDEDEIELEIKIDEPLIELSYDNESVDSDGRHDEHLVAFHKLQMTLDKSPEEKTPISKKYFENVPSLSIAVLNTRKMSDSELLNNLDYYKFMTWLDKDNTRYFQELAVHQMIKQANDQDVLYNIYCEGEFKKGKHPRRKAEFPCVGAVLVATDGNVIASSYKGCMCPNHYQGSIAEHCEYLLFEKVLGADYVERAEGGTLFVTLEPCVSRIVNKIPCAVRCLESGIKNIYIGTFDPDKTVSWKGIDILKTGTYKFNKREKYYSDKHGKELQKYFRDKGYSEIEDSLTLTFFIADPVNIFPFNADLTLEIIKRNEKFVKHHNWNLFVA